MQNIAALALLLITAVVYVADQPQDSCGNKGLSDAQVKQIVDTERTSRSDLPARFPAYRWVVRKQGCHYVYVEYGLPETPEYNHIFTINRHGVIVDADSPTLKCPEKTLNQSELGDIVRTERTKRRELPAPYARFETRLDRLRCLYLYFEYQLPERKGAYQVFTIDPFGEVLDFSRSEPY